MWAPSACSGHTDSGASSRRRAEAAASRAGLSAAISPELAESEVASMQPWSTRRGSSESQLAGSLLAESEDGGQRLVDAPLLVWADSAHQIAKPSCGDCSDLLNKNTGGPTEQLD